MPALKPGILEYCNPNGRCYFYRLVGGVILYIKLDDIKNIPMESLEELYLRHYNSAFYKLLKMNRLNLHFIKAEGINLWDPDGDKYMDFIGGYGSLNLGHNHPLILEAIKKHLDKPNFLQQNANLYSAVLANDISYLTRDKLPVCIFTNCGTEAVEEAVKIAYMYQKEGVIVYCSHAYHGKTMGAISALGAKDKKNYPYFSRTFLEIPFGDIDALNAVIKEHPVAAFLVEPVQGEGGIVLPPDGYFQQVQAVCAEHHVVFILDEIQTGLGRCGAMFCYERLGVVPDILCLAKSLSGGIMPIGCIAVSRRLWNATYDKPKNAILPSTTFGGNTLSSVAAIETLTILQDQKLCEKAEELGQYALKQLYGLKAKHRLITDVRGMGLLIGIEFGGLKKFRAKMIEKFMITAVISKMLNEHHILCTFTSNDPSVLRFEPPLLITRNEIDRFVESLDAVLNEETGEFQLLMDSVLNAAHNM